MTSPKLSIIFVAGGWHSESHVQPIIPYLESSSYRVVPVKLRTSIGALKDPLPTIEDNISHVASVIAQEVNAGYDVCLVGHSVSGQSCVGGINTFFESGGSREKVKHLIFIACFLDPLRSLVGADWFSIDTETMWATVNPLPNNTSGAYERFYNNMSPAAAQPFVDTLDANRAQMPPENLGDAWRGVKGKTYFVCGKDNGIAPEIQRLEAKECGMDVVEFDGDHCPYVSTPEAFAEEMRKVLG